MKVVIDIDEYTFECIKEHYDALPEYGTVSAYEYFIANGIPLPKTNGEVIQALFPNIDKNFSNIVDLRLWWNAKYKAESEDD